MQMLHISTAALLLFGTGFLHIMVSTANIQAHPGETVTMWCPHNIHVSGSLYWFKQTDGSVPITISYMLYTESLQKFEPHFYNNFTKNDLEMNQFSKSTTLTILNLRISDSGFYFCGFTGYPMKFGSGTRLDVKAQVEKHSSSTIKTTTTAFRSEKSYTGNFKRDHDKSPVSTEDTCSRDIFFKLTLLFACIIVLMCIIPLIWGIMREQKRQKHKKVAECQAQQHEDKETESVEYAAVHFKRPKTSRRQAEYTVSVYTDDT